MDALVWFLVGFIVLAVAAVLGFLGWVAVRGVKVAEFRLRPDTATVTRLKEMEEEAQEALDAIVVRRQNLEKELDPLMFLGP